MKKDWAAPTWHFGAVSARESEAPKTENRSQEGSDARKQGQQRTKGNDTPKRVGVSALEVLGSSCVCTRRQVHSPKKLRKSQQKVQRWQP